MCKFVGFSINYNMNLSTDTTNEQTTTRRQDLGFGKQNERI
jgi:hypothetical protein